MASRYQLEILPETNKYKQHDNFDRAELWDFVKRYVNPLTTVGATRVEDEIESKLLKEFGEDVSKNHTWLLDVRAQIIGEEEMRHGNYI